MYIYNRLLLRSVASSISLSSIFPKVAKPRTPAFRTSSLTVSYIAIASITITITITITQSLQSPRDHAASIFVLISDRFNLLARGHRTESFAATLMRRTYDSPFLATVGLNQY